MVYTRFGTPVTLLQQPDNEGWILLLAHYPMHDGGTLQKFREYHISDLRIDGGLPKLTEEIDKLPQKCKLAAKLAV